MIARLKKLLRSGALIIGAGLILTFLYTKVMERVPKDNTLKRHLERSNFPQGTLQRLEERDYDISDKRDSEDQEILRGQCKWVEPWFPKHSQWKHTQLVFYGKPIMQALKAICIERHWKMTLIINDTSPGLKQLEHLTSLNNTFTIVVTASRYYKHPLIQRLANSTNTLVSAIRYAYKIAGGKKGQLIAFRKHFATSGCDLEQREVMPKSFILDDSSDCVQFFKYANAKPDAWWVLKQSQGYGGTGITIHRDLATLHKDFGVCSNNKEFVVQEYLSNVLLIEKRKFDVRGLVLIANTNPYMLFYHDGYLRLSIKEYSASGDRSVHITNSHLQVMTKGFVPDKHIWSFPRFQAYLDEHFPNNDGFVSNELIPYIKNTAVFIVREGQNIFTPYPSSYQLLGLDFMVTSDFHIWFIEANNYPLWPKGSPSIDEFIETMGNDMFDLLTGLRQTPSKFMSMHSDDWFKSWQLVWNELDETCSDDIDDHHYNPCDLFPEQLV